MGQRDLLPGEVIFQRGDPSEHAYVIESGQIEILKGEGGRSLRLALLGVGQIFGEMGLVDERPRVLTARAVTEAQVTTVTRDELVDMLFRRPEEGLKYLRMLFERLRAMNSRVALAEEAETATSPEQIMARVTLFPLSAEGAKVVPAKGLVLDHFPFRVGRASKRGERDPLGMNDLALQDEAPYRVSRHHVSFDLAADQVVVRDRGSYLGTVVNGTRIGGELSIAQVALRPGENRVALGTADSAFRFRVVVTIPPDDVPMS
jgi:CRP-like cAMP-binding protein